MKGGYFVGIETDVFRAVETILIEMGGTSWSEDDKRSAQSRTKDGQLFFLYESNDDALFDIREEPVYAAPGVEAPDMSQVTACLFECRWEDLVVEIALAASKRSASTFWLVDGNGVVWDAASVDSKALFL